MIALIFIIQLGGGILIGRQVGQMMVPYLRRAKRPVDRFTLIIFGLAVAMAAGFSWGEVWRVAIIG